MFYNYIYNQYIKEYIDINPECKPFCSKYNTAYKAYNVIGIVVYKKFRFINYTSVMYLNYRDNL